MGKNFQEQRTCNGKKKCTDLVKACKKSCKQRCEGDKACKKACNKSAGTSACVELFKYMEKKGGPVEDDSPGCSTVGRRKGESCSETSPCCSNFVCQGDLCRAPQDERRSGKRSGFGGIGIMAR